LLPSSYTVTAAVPCTVYVGAATTARPGTRSAASPVRPPNISQWAGSSGTIVSPTWRRPSSYLRNAGLGFGTAWQVALTLVERHQDDIDILADALLRSPRLSG
jgi:hypothetical protein